MRFIQRVLLLVVLIVVAVFAYNYWSGNGWTLRAPTNSTGVNVESVRQAATTLEGALSDGALSAKIKSKMALDDQVKARTISVDTKGSVVTLTGTVDSSAERDRAVRLAKETDGVTKVVDNIAVKTR